MGGTNQGNWKHRNKFVGIKRQLVQDATIHNSTLLIGDMRIDDDDLLVLNYQDVKFKVIEGITVCAVEDV